MYGPLGLGLHYGLGPSSPLDEIVGTFSNDNGNGRYSAL